VDGGAELLVFDKDVPDTAYIIFEVKQHKRSDSAFLARVQASSGGIEFS
jgi:hypothetical protein